MVYYHPYDFVCGSGEVRTIYPERIDAPDFWQESHDLVRVGEREFLRKLVQNSAPTTNEEGVRIDGRDQTSRHTFTPDGEVLVHRTTTLRYPDISRVQARETAEGELLWEVVVDGPVDRIVIAGDTVLIRATDAAGFDGIATIDLVSGELIGAVATTYRLVGAA